MQPPRTSAVGPIPLRIHPAARGGASAVLFLHGLRASGEVHDKEARALVAAGFTVLLPDAPHHGARRSELLDAMQRASRLDAHRLLLRVLREARDEIPALVDHALALGHPRVAVAGISMGAFVALAAATVEPRLAAIVSIFGSPDWTLPGLEPPPDLAPLLAEAPDQHLESFPPRPLLLLNGGRDQNVPPEPARRFAEALRPLYDARGGTLVHRELPEADHFPSERDWNDLWASAVAFLVSAAA